MNMKNKKFYILSAIAIVFGMTVFQSCLDDDDDDYYNYFPNALVTVKQGKEGFYFQLDDKTTLKPKDFAINGYKKEVRALANLDIIGYDNWDDAVEDLGREMLPTKVNYLDTILTKTMSPSVGNLEANLKEYGKAGVEVMNHWTTVCEDGYLTLNLRFPYGSVPSKISLIYGVNPENPYEVLLTRDFDSTSAYEWVNAFVAFDLSKLPDTGDKKVKLKLTWKAINNGGEMKSHEFDYQTRK